MRLTHWRIDIACSCLEFVFNHTLSAHELSCAAKRASKSAAGVDGWTYAELAILPEDAWRAFMSVCSENPLSLFSSLSSVYKRVPIPKKAGDVEPLQIRPMDVFSCLLRTHASVLVLNLRRWSEKVLLKSQYASSGGVLAAVASIAWRTELAYLGLQPATGVSIDFEKMFNRLSPHVAAASAVFMGLSSQFAHDLLCPLVFSKGVWRLPHNAWPRTFTNSRGLPQGMASSVLMSELAIAPLPRKIWHRFGERVTTIAYVDDLNFLGSEVSSVERVVDVLREFSGDFRLSLSDLKSKVWSSREWAVCKGAKPEFSKEIAMMTECETRLERLRHLSLNPVEMSTVISAGCLAKLDYLNLPTVNPYLPLRTLVKTVLGHPVGAPEIVLGILQHGTIDPTLRWLVAGLRLWFGVLQTQPSDEEVDVVAASKGRLGRIAKFADSLQISISTRGFQLGEAMVTFRNLWSVARKTIIAHCKHVQAKALASRRPALFGGLERYNVKQHSTLLRSLSELDASCLLKIWTGSVMCGHKRAQMFGGDAACLCGEQDQTWEHVLWHCPMIPPPPVNLLHLSRLPLAFSVSLILPWGASPADTIIWRHASEPLML